MRNLAPYPLFALRSLAANRVQLIPMNQPILTLNGFDITLGAVSLAFAAAVLRNLNPAGRGRTAVASFPVRS